MTNQQLLEGFAKGTTSNKIKAANCVIYTRVSSKEQALNMSLGIQKKACEEHARKIGCNIAGHFGGTYESAKTDERVEFNKMLAFAKKNKPKINMIIVYSVDRFSRSGANAIYIAEKLKKEGIIVYAVTQPTDASTASGSFQQNIQFIFSEYDNQLRREKTIGGMREMLLRGDWCCMAPLGYDIVKREGKRMLVINPKGKLIRKAFYWKAKEKLTSEEVRKRLGTVGLKMSAKKISWIFRNPFYCGLMSHNLLGGQVVKGNHERLVSEELFLEVNGLLANNPQGYRIGTDNEHYPLKRFLKCGQCGEFLRASKHSNIYYYYQCNTKGCSCSRRVEDVHKVFRSIIDGYTLNMDDDMRYLLREQMIATYNQLSEEGDQVRDNVTKELKEVNRKLDRLEERFILEEIKADIYAKFEAKFKEERKELEKQLGGLGDKVSNLEECIDLALDFSSKLAATWDLSDYRGKQEIQDLLFPDGIYYTSKNDACRTEKVNEVFSCIARYKRVLENGGDNIETGDDQNGRLVAPMATQSPQRSTALCMAARTCSVQRDPLPNRKQQPGYKNISCGCVCSRHAVTNGCYQ